MHKLNGKLHFGVVGILLIAFLFFLSLDGYLDLNNNSKAYTAGAFDIIDQRMESVLSEINIFPRHTGNDVLFLSKMSSLKNYVNEDSPTEDSLVKLKRDFLEFSKENIAYYQLRYLDEFGQEILRVDYENETHIVVPEYELQDKSGRYYFTETMNLEEKDVYISPLDLNVERGVLQNLGTPEDPIYVPMIRYATPVFNDKGERKGIIIANVYGDYFLDDIRSFQRDSESVFLINQEGYYLAHPDNQKEFGFMTGIEANINKDYPDIAERILKQSDSRRIETKNEVFSFKYIFPTSGSFEVHKTSEKLFGEDPEKHYFWILVSISDKTELNNALADLKKNYYYFLFFSTLFIIVIFVFSYKLGHLRGKKKRGK